MRHTSAKSGFTLLELLVAVSISVVMMLLINLLFQQTVAAVSLGSGTSDVLHQGSSVNTQLQKDFGVGAEEIILRNSLPGNPDDDRDVTSSSAQDPVRVGVLIIATHFIDNDTANAATPSEQDEVFLESGQRGTVFIPEDSDGDGHADVRSDQLVFLRNTYPGEAAITPQTTDANASVVPVGAARVWYGHLQPTIDDGTEANGDDPTDTDEYWFYQNPANDWILGRQAMYFLDPDDDNHSEADPYNSGTPMLTRDDIHVAVEFEAGDVDRGLTDGSTMTSNTSTLPSGVSVPRLAFTSSELENATDAPNELIGNNARLYHGTTDIIAARIDELFHDFGNSGTGNIGSNGGPLGSFFRASVDSENTDYAQNAAQLAFAENRLWVNPRPHDPNTGDPARLLEWWQQSQMHAYLATGVSDFEVHFAGDYEENPINGGTPGPSDGPDTPDGLIDVDDENEILWYNSLIDDSKLDGIVNNAITGNKVLVVPLAKSQMAAADRPQVPVQREGPVVPALPLASGATIPSLGLSATDARFIDHLFVFRHDEPQSWPDLIRIRYRMHDRGDRIADRRTDLDPAVDSDNDGFFDNDNDGPARPGRVFEVILRVPG
ncbi:MAG: prepilin-type N-terminal cleavage/methylation domain-containing protein [Planctomycetota bacterium]